jgi:hypothetical protein
MDRYETRKCASNAATMLPIGLPFKGTTQSYAEAIRAGHFTKVTNEWKRMTAMDVSDIYYNKFLINGKTKVK